MNGDEASPSVTAGHTHTHTQILMGLQAKATSREGGVMSALKGGPGVSLGTEGAACAVLIYKVG